MFEDQKDSNEKLKVVESQQTNSFAESILTNKVAVLLSILFLFIVVLGGIFLLGFLRNHKPTQIAQDNPVVSTSTIDQPKSSSSTLPINPQNIDDQNQANDNEFNKVKAETLAFAQFYEKPVEDFVAKPNNLKLPLQIKTEVANYYDISRKLDLSEESLNDLNTKGATILSNQISPKSDDFYGAYKGLINNNIPQLITSDFIIYNYQNRIKEIFDDIKSNTFYRDLWLINKNFFDIASNRYRKTLASSGVVNSPVLEGQRLEAAYFATALELLKPKTEQIRHSEIANNSDFTDQDVNQYDFSLPDYLNEDVSKEVQLILGGQKNEKSPVFRYQKNYKDFSLPTEYQNNNKLKNFYLANIWANSIFPLYFKDNSCPNCLLDKNDWLINFVANSYIAKDFSDNQELKNRWARIYKVLSYFSGLRKDLTYLNFQDALVNLYGPDYKIENIFSTTSGQEQALSAALGVQSRVVKKFSFLNIEGAIDRQDKNSKPNLGMRLLQQPFWPDYYIFNQLIAPNVTSYNKKISGIDPLPKNNTTGCKISNNKYQRCGAVSLDIINLYSPVVDNSYFNENSSYSNYSSQSRAITDQLNDFTVDTWHNSNYWSIMNLNSKTILNHQGFEGPIYSTNDFWKKNNMNTALSAWANLRLPADELIINYQEENKLSASESASIYVEPNLELIDELLANCKMLSGMLNSLKIIRDVDFATKKINELTEDLNKEKQAVKTELSGNELDDPTEQSLSFIVKRYAVIKKLDKTVRFTFNGGMKIIDKINGVRLLTAVYQLKDKKIIVVGPEFNFQGQ